MFDCCWLRLLWCLCDLVVGGFASGFGGTCEVGWVVWLCVRFVCYVGYWRVSGLSWGVVLMFLAGVCKCLRIELALGLHLGFVVCVN